MGSARDTVSMKIIVISSSGTSDTEPAVVTQLFENGLDIFHLRKPKMSTKEMRSYIERIPKGFHNRIIIHSHHKLARRYKLMGVHLTKSHRKRKFRTWLSLKLVRMKNPGIIITSSFRTIANLFEEEDKYDYVFLSPIFDSLTSKFQSGFNSHSLRGALSKTSHKVIARGGVDINCLESVKELGFAGFALYSTIWKNKEPVKQFIRIKERCHELGLATV
jgi:thiamine-phosphate pyrophosphorylase